MSKRVAIPEGHKGVFFSRFKHGDIVRVGSKRGEVIGVGFGEGHVFYDVAFTDGSMRFNVYASDVEPMTMRLVL